MYILSFLQYHEANYIKKTMPLTAHKKKGRETRPFQKIIVATISVQ